MNVQPTPTASLSTTITGCTTKNMYVASLRMSRTAGPPQLARWNLASPRLWVSRACTSGSSSRIGSSQCAHMAVSRFNPLLLTVARLLVYLGTLRHPLLFSVVLDYRDLNLYGKPRSPGGCL